MQKLFYLILIVLFACCTGKKQNKKSISFQELPTIKLTKEQVFGDTNDVMFDRIGLVEVDDKNRVYISESSLGRRIIHVFSADGNYLKDISREGDGPGEFRTLAYMHILSNKLYLFDSFHNRMSVYTIASDSNIYSFSGSWNISASSFSHGKNIAKTFVFKKGELLVGIEDPNIPNNPERNIYYYLFDTDMKRKQDKVLFEQNAVTIYKTNVNSFSVTMKLPFSRRPLICVSNTGLIFKAWSDNFKIDVLNSAGEQIRTISYPFKNTTLNKSEVIQWYKSNNDFYRAVQKAPFPETWPVLNGLMVDDENRLWVATIVKNLEIYEWWVLKNTGEVITKFDWPRDKAVKIVKNGYLYTQEKDGMGVSSIVKYKIEMN